MTPLELLAPARNADIGIAAIDCGADAVYIAGPAFGARKDAGNPVSGIAALCEYAHKFGARVFVTFNISVEDSELMEMHRQMLEAQEAGADAFIIRDERIAGWDDIRIPLHASTQCAIRTVEDARRFEALGCERIILERELSLDTVREICSAVSCEVEFFVHGALCVCYSGECRLSEHIAGRSADRGECIQACRSLYDLEDASGRKMVRNKALLSLKDFNLKSRLKDLADAGVSSFKIEGRLKSISYVRNVVRDYSLALDRLVESDPSRYCRASFGRSLGGFSPDLRKTFNREYTSLFIDGTRGQWATPDAPKSIGEPVGKVESVRPAGKSGFELRLTGKVPRLSNGDGFSFIGRTAIEGFRGDVCEGSRIISRSGTLPAVGTPVYRNLSAEFEKAMDSAPCRRMLQVSFDVCCSTGGIDITARCEDGRSADVHLPGPFDTAQNRERAEAILREGLSKKVDEFVCGIVSLKVCGDDFPLVNSARINQLRRDAVTAITVAPGPERARRITRRNPLPPRDEREFHLMRSKYCIRYELGMCPVHQGAKPSGPLFLVNNGRRLALGFDCRNCEMTVD